MCSAHKAGRQLLGTEPLAELIARPPGRPCKLGLSSCLVFCFPLPSQLDPTFDLI